MQVVGPFRYLENHAKLKPDSPALVHGDMSMTFAKVHQLACSIGTAMRSTGVKPGQVVLLATGNAMLDYIFMLAAMHEAAVSAIQVGPKYVPEIEADLAFARTPIDGFPFEKTIFIDDDWVVRAEATEPLPAISFANENAVARLLQTSGTTGTPKILEFEIETLADIHEQWMQGSPERLPVKSLPEKTFCIIPFTVFGGSITWGKAFRDGHPYYLATGKTEINLRMIATYDITRIMASPAFISDLFSNPEYSHVLKKIEFVISGGAAMPAALIASIREKSNAIFVNRMGSTEAVSGVAWKEIHEADPEGYVGRPYEGSEIVIFDENLNSLPPETVGRIGVKTPHMRTFYRNNRAATAKHFVNGYFFSGDEGYLTTDGDFYLVGRTDERINAGGSKRDPNELDGLVKNIAGVNDAATFGFDLPNGIRSIAVALVLQNGFSVKSLGDQISDSLRFGGALVLIEVPSIPRNTMGKVQRIDLEKQLTPEAVRLVTMPRL